MSIGRDTFRSEGGFITYDPFDSETCARVIVYFLQCRQCGFEPDSQGITAPRICPKCHGATRERFARPGSLLDAAEGRTPRA